MTEKEINPARSHERSIDSQQLGEIARERSEVLRSTLEEHAEKHEKQQESDRNNERVAFEEATKLAKESEKGSVPIVSPAERRRPAPSKKQREASLKAQLNQVQNEMNTSGRIISKVIHTKLIEDTSDVAASTVARPNALLSGSIAAFVGVTACYFVAKYYGYQLSGFETIAAFIFGWAIGILYDYFSVMIRGIRKNR